MWASQEEIFTKEIFLFFSLMNSKGTYLILTSNSKNSAMVPSFHQLVHSALKNIVPAQ